MAPPRDAIALAVSFIIIYIIWNSRRSPPSRLPPGPKGLWGLGNIFDFPKSHYWMQFTEWSSIYGDVISLRIPRRPFIVLNTIESAKALFEQRGSYYSDRPVMPMAGELMGFDRSMGLMHYSDTWKLHRKLAQKMLNPDSLKIYAPAQEKVVAQFLKNLLDYPEFVESHLHLASGSIILICTYGIEVDDSNNQLLKYAQETVEVIQKAIAVGYTVDFVPALKHLPAWFPFTDFKRVAMRGKSLFQYVTDSSFEYTKQELSRGNDIKCFVASLLQDKDDILSTKEENDIKWVATSLFGGGEETTSSTILSFLYAMILYPEIQVHAQQELDSVVGTSRLPSLSDKAKLPYINAMLKEVWRWRPPLPIGLPHQNTKEDTYKGMSIPNESFLLANIWAISRQVKSTYPPDQFAPERFLEGDSSELDPFSYVFGVGRRICPGRYFADNVAFLFICNILASFIIARPIDVNGNPIPINHTFTDGTTSHPAELKIQITPRSENTHNLILKRLRAVE